MPLAFPIIEKKKNQYTKICHHDKNPIKINYIIFQILQ